LIAWQNEGAMNAYRITPPHRHAMPKLLEWGDEAAVVHWNQESAELQDWKTAWAVVSDLSKSTNLM
jgi:hypothetical protein